MSGRLPADAVSSIDGTTCIVFTSVPGWSESFLQAHIERLSGAVCYADSFPIDENATFNEKPDSGTEKIKQLIRWSWHRYVLNPLKRRRLRTFFRKQRIHAVLAEYGFTGVAVLQTCKELKIPLVVHFHGSDAYSHDVLDRHRSAYRDLFAYASAIIAVSRHMTDQLIKLGAPASKVIYNPYGIAVDRFIPAAPAASRVQAIAVGRFVEKKAPYLTILAFKKVLDRLPEAKLLMVGDGPLYDVCSRIVKALHIEHAVDLRGIVGNDEISVLMQQSSVFVQHSLVPESGDMEGTPLAILEAGASGIPVVSTRHAGIPDVVKHGETGFLVEEGDVDGMSEYLFQLLSDAQMAGRMGQKARDHVCKNFEVRHSTDKLREIVEKTVQRSNPKIA